MSEASSITITTKKKKKKKVQLNKIKARKKMSGKNKHILTKGSQYVQSVVLVYLHQLLIQGDLLTTKTGENIQKSVLNINVETEVYYTSCDTSVQEILKYLNKSSFFILFLKHLLHYLLLSRFFTGFICFSFVKIFLKHAMSNVLQAHVPKSTGQSIFNFRQASMNEPVLYPQNIKYTQKLYSVSKTQFQHVS